jgi:hypothetical protein
MSYASRTRHAPLTAITALFLVVGGISVSNAQSINPSLDDIFQLRLGPFFAHFDTKVNVQGTDFDQDEQLGDNETTFAGFARWRITPKFHLNFGYSQISRDNTATLSAGLPVGGITVPAGTTLSQDYETSSLPVSLSWAFVKNPKTEFGVDAGVNFTKIKNRISVAVPGAPTVTPINDDVSEPLPSIGLFWNQALSEQWMFAGSFRYLGLSLEIGDIDAEFYDAFVGIEWRPWKNVGLGGAYLYSEADGTITSAGTTHGFEYQYDGPFAYIMIGGGVR